MSFRITIMIDEDLLKKLRYKQATKIGKSHSSYSFSRAMNDELRKVLK